MMPIKHMDPILGVDVHIVLIPTPAGPIPTPIPHPHVGMIMDPFDYVPILGSALYVNNMVKASAGTAGLLIPPSHIPMGGPFAPPPGNESEMFMGSATVDAEGDPFSFMGCPVISCMTVGMPAPVRPKKKGASVSLFAPVTQAMPIPMGMPVMVGGPPTISLFGMAMKAIGPMLGLLKKLAKKSKTVRRLVKAGSDRAHDAASAIMRKLDVPPNAQRRVHDGICSVTGHPVDVASGRMFTERSDFTINGPLPFEFSRSWQSCSTHRGPLGHGWHHNWDVSLFVDEAPAIGDEAGVMLRASDGRYIGFLQVPVGGSHFNRQEKMTLSRDERGYRISTREGLKYRFKLSGLLSRGSVSDLPLAYVSDRSGNRITLQYDEQGHLVCIRDSCGRLFGFENDAEGYLTQITAPHPEEADKRVCLMAFFYDQTGALIEARDALGYSDRFVYKQNLMVQETDKNGLSFYFEYDQAGPEARCTRTWGDGGIYDHKITYDEELGVTFVVNSLGHKTTYHHDGAVVLRVVDAHGNEESTTYSENYDVVEVVDALGRTTSYSYDERGNRTHTVYPDGVEEITEFDPRDLAICATDSLANAWRIEYDEYGRIAERLNPQQEKTSYSYLGPHLVAVTDPLGHVTRLGYDSQGLLEQVVEADGSRTQCRYDALGQAIEIVNPVDGVYRRSFDLRGAILKVETPTGYRRTFEYDAEQNVVRETDGEKDVCYRYQGMNRLASRTEHGVTVEFLYNTEEQTVALRNGQDSVYQFQYDPTGLVVGEKGFDGLRRVYTRDAAGQVVRVARPGKASSDYDYDLLGRMISVRHSDGSAEFLGYRADGELAEVRNNVSTIEFERDAVGRICKEVQKFKGGEAHWVGQVFNKRGEVLATKSSLGADVAIKRDALGGVQSVARGRSAEVGGHSISANSADFAVEFQRDLLGLELERSLPGGIRSKWKRDLTGRPVHHNTEGPNGARHRAVEYHWGAGNRLLKTVNALTQQSTSYRHDGLGGLAWARGADGTAVFRMPDAVGNVFRTEDRSDRKYGPAGRLLESYDSGGVTKYTYDDEGRLVEKHAPQGRVWRYHWNGANRLASVERPDGSTVSFLYDALGRRLAKTYCGQTTRWVWNGDVPLHEWVEGEYVGPQDNTVATTSSLPGWYRDAALRRREAELNDFLLRGPPRDGDALLLKQNSFASRGSIDSPVTWIFEPESHAPMAKLVGDQAYSIVTDHIGTPVGIYDNSGAQVWSAEIAISGELVGLKGASDESQIALSAACPFRWAGQYEDIETGLYYNRHRYFDREMGQYIQQDPIRLNGGMALYAYVHDPTLFVDELGLAQQSCTGRGKNRLTADQDAVGPHSTFNRNADGNITGHAEYTPNPRNPTGFDEVKRVDTQHANPHTHKDRSTGNAVPTPHVHEGKNCRPARPDELPS